MLGLLYYGILAAVGLVCSKNKVLEGGELQDEYGEFHIQHMAHVVFYYQRTVYAAWIICLISAYQIDDSSHNSTRDLY